jgi:hypothetical protein
LFVAASGEDWCLKQIGGVFYREYIPLVGGVLPNNLPPYDPDVESTISGYESILRGLMPLGYPDTEKIVRNVFLDHDTVAQDDPCLIRLKIGTSYHLADPNLSSGSCAVQWNTPEYLSLSCPDEATVQAMTALNQRPTDGTEWAVYEMGRYLYYDLSVLNWDKSDAIGGDSAWLKVEFETQLV